MDFIFKPVRWVLAQIIIFIDWAIPPKKVQRSVEKQRAVDKQTEKMALYQFKQCPFCVKTRRQFRRLALNIETRDARNDPQWNQELIEKGGKYQVPCLKIIKDDGSVEWLYESNSINQYLAEKYSANNI